MINCPLPFRGAPPDRERWVLGQAFNFDPDRWKRLLPDPALWPEELDDCPTGNKWPYVARATVFTAASRAQERVGALRAYVAASVWGSGTQTRIVERRSRVLAGDWDQTGQRLAQAVETQMDRDPVAAFDRLHGRGNLVRDLGPSFGTKVLYFAGYDPSSTDVQPLILDQYVAEALNRLCGLSWPTSQGGWSTQQYEDYLHLAHRWAHDWETTADVVERVLFDVGKAPRLAVSALSKLPATT